MPLKRSDEYRSIRKEVADPKPLDSWQAGTLHYFVFQLNQAPSSAGQYALFTMSFEHDQPLQALRIWVRSEGSEVEVGNLRAPFDTRLIKLDSPQS